MAARAEENPAPARAHDVMELDDDESSDISGQPEGEEEEDDDDPVINEFDVFVTPKARELLLLFQYVGRHKSQPFSGPHAPTEMRVKPESGYFEIDVPINIQENYDRVKGVRFGEAMRKTKGFGQTAYGEAGGFDRKMPKSTRRPNANTDDADAADAPPPVIPDDDNLDDYVANFEDANEKGHVLNKLTWGGKLYKQPDWKPNYMVGTFRGKELHLSVLDGTITMQPEVHHVDAINQLETAARRREDTNKEPRAFIPTVKREDDPVAAILKGAADEEWHHLRYYPEDSPEAMDAFRERMFHPDPANAPVLEIEDGMEYLNRIFPVVVGKNKTKATHLTH